MKKLLYSVLMLTTVMLFQSCEKDLMEDVNDGGWNNERNILAIGLQAQIGLSKIERTGDEATVKIVVNAGALDLAAVNVTDIVLSYDATANVAAGDKLNFDNAENKSSISVTSKKGESLQWTIIIEPFINEIEGSWKISSYYIKWDDGNGWGNAGEAEFSALMPAATTGLDDVITFGAVEGADENGQVYGNYERTLGADGEGPSFVYERTGENWASKFSLIPVGKGEWLLNKDNSITITVDGKSYTTQIFEKSDDSHMKLPLAPGAKDSGRINWNDYYGDHTNKFCVTTDLWYSLEKQ